jgi:hypothetical protein
MYVHYYIALAAADRGDESTARNAVAEAERSGLPRKLLEKEPALKPLLTGSTS